MTPRRSRIGQLVARLCLRGPDAPFVLRDLDDAFDHDVARGLDERVVRRRDLMNVLASVGSVWAQALRPSAWRPSLLDVRLGLRAIARTPGSSAVAVCALAIGIPAGLAPMHAVEALERPWPGDPDGRLRAIRYWRDTAPVPVTAGDYLMWRTSLRSFGSLAAYRPMRAALDADGLEVSVPAVETTAETFEILRVPAVLGRVLRADDTMPGAPDVAVISDDLWRTRFAGAPDVVGRPLTVGGTTFAVVGVMPPGFRFPTAQQLWLPLRLADAGAGPRSGAPLAILGRLLDGAPADTAQAELDALTSTLAAADPVAFARLRPAVLPPGHLSFDFPTPGGLRALPEFPLVQVLMLAPLLVACVNVGLLIAAQTSTRAAEFAVRTALGASRGRIVTQVFVECLVLAVAAAALGLLLLDALPAVLLPRLGITIPYWIDTGLTAATVRRALLLAVGCAAAAGAIPALRLTGRAIDANLKRARAGRSGRRLGGWQGALVVLDVAVAVMAIAVGAGLWGKVQAASPNEATDGIRAGEVLSATLDVRAPSHAQVARVQTALAEALRGEPEVRAVTYATVLPRMDHPVRRLEVAADPAGGPALAVNPVAVRTARVAVGYFAALGRPLVAGRAFDAADLEAGTGAVVVNTTFATRVFGPANPLGRRVREVSADGASTGPWLEIVGVVGPMGLHALTPSQDDGVYLPLAPGDANPVRLAIWTRGDPARVAPRLRVLASAIDPDTVVADPVALDAVFEGDRRLLQALVLAAAVLVAVLLSLAVSALYAILSLAVSRRTREIGIRVALGADRWAVTRDVAERAVFQVGAGVLLGLPAAGAVAYEVIEMAGAGRSVAGAVTLAVTLGVAVAGLVSIAACTAPTLRALRIAPMDALRQDQ